MDTFLQGLWGFVAIPAVVLALVLTFLVIYAVGRVAAFFGIPIILFSLGGWSVYYGASSGSAGFVGLGLFVATLGAGALWLCVVTAKSEGIF